MQHGDLLHAFEHQLQLLTGSADAFRRSAFLNERQGPLWTSVGPARDHAGPLASLEQALLPTGPAGLARMADLRHRAGLRLAASSPIICPWLEELERYLTAGDERVTASEDIPFARAFQPFLTAFLQQRDTRRRALFGARALQSLVDGLARQLSAVCSMTLYCSLCDEQGGLEPSAHSYREFCEELARGRWIELAMRYPVMGRLMIQRAALFGDAVDELADRFLADRPALDESLLPGCLERCIHDIHPGLGDTHNSGRAVMRLHLDGGAILYYKPKPLANEHWFNDVLVPAMRAQGVPLGAVPVLDRGTHGWARDARGASTGAVPADESAVRESDMARVAAVFYLLNGTDFHFENLVNSPAACYAIDLETLFNALPFEDDADGSQWRRWTFLSTDMLRARFGYEGGAADVSGLYAESFEAPFPIYSFEVTQEGTVRLQIWRPDADRQAHSASPAASHRAVPDPSPSLADAIPDALSQTRRAIPAVLEKLPPEAISRFVMRPTMFYTRLFQRLYMPRFLTDAALFSIELNGLCAGLSALPEDRQACLSAVFDSEIIQLQRGDVPYFCYSPFSKALWADGEVVADDFFTQTGLSLVSRKLAELAEEDVREETALVSASVALSQFSWTEARRRQSAATDRALEPGIAAQSCIAECCTLMAREIVSAARTLPNGRTRWIGHVGDAAAKSLVPHMSDDAYFGGYWGVMSYLAGCASFLRQSDRPDPELEQFLTNEADTRHRFPGYAPSARSVVGLDGVAGLVIAYLRLIDLDPARWMFLEERLAACLASLSNERLRVDPVPDIIAGNAGLLLALSLLVAHPGPAISDQLRVQAAGIMAISVETLLDSAVVGETGLFWRSPLSRHGLIGFAHGNAGYLAALAQCLTACDRSSVLLAPVGVDRITSTIEQALAWERSSRIGGDWPDLRPELGRNATLNASWCHGLSGLGLSRVALLRTERFRNDPVLMQELVEIVERLLEQPEQAIFDTACCGAAGEWELLLSAARLLPERGWLEQAHARTGAAAKRIATEGGYRGFMGSVTPIALSPSLFQGAAGVGDVLVRTHQAAACNLYGLLSA